MKRAWPIRTFVLAAFTLGVLVILFRNSGRFLVVDNRQKSDALVITQGDSLDAQYWTALRLLREGYGREVFLDARINLILFGRSQADLARDFVKRTAGNDAGHVKVCAIAGDTTAQEVYEVANCLQAIGARSALLVVDDFHTRRSLAMFSRLMPQYRWSIVPVADDTRFSSAWWRKREWVRTAVVEWQHLLWWEFVDRWRFPPATGAISGARSGALPDR
jgi:uncharacterized SAM-binding protein YcdF (DUF218 family)